MNTTDTLVNRLNALMEKETSGIVARFEDDTVITWIHPLKTLFARQEWGDSYLACDSAADAENFLSGFAGQPCQCPISESGDAEQQYLSDCLWSLLWDMVHEEPEIDCEIDFDRFRLYPLTGAETVEKDIAAFLQLLGSHEIFKTPHTGKDQSSFCADIHQDDESGPIYILYRIIPEPFTDEKTGDNVQIDRYYPIIQADSAGSLYAKSRAFLAG